MSQGQCKIIFIMKDFYSLKLHFFLSFQASKTFSIASPSHIIHIHYTFLLPFLDKTWGVKCLWLQTSFKWDVISLLLL